MILCYIHTSVPYSAIITDASFWNRWEQRESQPDNMQRERERDLGRHSSKWFNESWILNSEAGLKPHEHKTLSDLEFDFHIGECELISLGLKAKFLGQRQSPHHSQDRKQYISIGSLCPQGPRVSTVSWGMPSEQQACVVNPDNCRI